MERPAAEFARAFEGVAIRRPRLTYLSSSLARPLFEPARIAADLAGNMASLVRWRDSARLAWERGARLAVEMPPGHTLTRLCAETFGNGCAAFEATPVDTLVALIASAAE